MRSLLPTDMSFKKRTSQYPSGSESPKLFDTKTIRGKKDVKITWGDIIFLLEVAMNLIMKLLDFNRNKIIESRRGLKELIEKRELSGDF